MPTLSVEYQFLGLGDFRQVAPVISGAGKVAFPRSLICEIFSVMGKKSGFHAQRFSTVIDDIREDFSSERHCFIEVQIPNTTKIYCPLITFTFNPQGSSWTVNRRQFPLRARYATARQVSFFSRAVICTPRYREYETVMISGCCSLRIMNKIWHSSTITIFSPS